MNVLIAQSRPLFCDSMDYSLPGSSVHGVLQARILEWVATPFPRDLPDPGMEPRSSALQADPLLSEPAGKRAGCFLREAERGVTATQGGFRSTLSVPRGRVGRDLPWTPCPLGHLRILYDA